MKGFRHPSIRTPSTWAKVYTVHATLIACGCVGSFDQAMAQQSGTQPGSALQSNINPVTNLGQVPTAQLPLTANFAYTPVAPISTQAPFEPPLNPPLVEVLPTGLGALTFDRWIISPTLDLYTLYDTNVHQSSTVPLSGPGFHFHPAVSADFNTGLYDTQLYGNIDSTVYPTLDFHNNTFNRQAGIIQKYSPLRALVFTVQADYTHNTNANVLVQSLPAPIASPGSPPPPGAAGVLASQQTVVNPNNVYTLTGTIYKEFNRAFIKLDGIAASTKYEAQPTQSYNAMTYDGSGGFWLSSLFYAYGDGIQSFTSPELGTPSNYFRARAGIGTALIGWFRGAVYYGQQGAEVNGDGKAGGDIYGGVVSYYPSPTLNMSFAVDRLRNLSDITSGNTQALGGLNFVAVGVSPSQSSQITTITYKANYTLSPQTSGYFVFSVSQIDLIGSMPHIVETSWFTDFGLQHVLQNTPLTLSLDYQYTRFISPTPQTSFNRNLVTLGAHYRF
jgi:hypothetical protein